jgi:2-keto-4-pentenoate hydratase/2-oxohepta-3-ene-1,7-dioic acid hydratase in catechol pathway
MSAAVHCSAWRRLLVVSRLDDLEKLTGADVTLWVRFEKDGIERHGTLDADAARIDVHDGDMFSDAKPAETSCAFESVKLLAPVRPGKFIGLWNNFHEQAAKQGLSIPARPLYFMKGSNAINDPDGVIRQPSAQLSRIAYEGELGVVIGKTCRDADETAATDAIFGYTCINDVTAIEAFGDNPAFSEWTRAKSCDTFGPIGPVIATDIDFGTARVRTLVNGRERQNYPLTDMIFPPARIVSLISHDMTLAPGDVIACGTSLGVLPMRPGTIVEVVIDGIGTLRNRYEALASQDKAVE